jgi:hypothetical protein
MDSQIVKTLADLVVSTALVDQTQPDAKGRGWRTDELLREIDAFVVGKLNRSDLYADIGRLVLSQVEHLPEIAIMARLAIFRGERLMPLTEDRQQRLIKWVGDLQNAIDYLPIGPRQKRCESLLNYHAGVFYDACGRFDLASQLQWKSAGEALSMGDSAGGCIAKFLSSFYGLKDALLKNDSVRELLLEDLGMTFDELRVQLRNSPLYVQWAKCNCPLHMMQACVWLGCDCNAKWITSVTAAAERLGAAFKPAADFARALKACEEGDPEANNALRIAIQSGGGNEMKATAILALMRRVPREQRQELFSKMPEQGAQHVMAIAKRLLEAK